MHAQGGLSREIGETLEQAESRIRGLYWVHIVEPTRNCARCGVNVLLHPALSQWCDFAEQLPCPHDETLELVSMRGYHRVICCDCRARLSSDEIDRPRRVAERAKIEDDTQDYLNPFFQKTPDEVESEKELVANSDDELPGMWERADFIGGDPDTRSYAQRERDKKTNDGE